MDERVVKFRVGVMVLATVIIAGILVLLFGDARSLARGQYSVFIHFDDAPGVTEGTPIRKSGILIGRVHRVRFAEQGGVVVEARIDGDVELFRDEMPQVSGSLLGGDVVIQFVRQTKPVEARPRPSPADDNAQAARPRATNASFAQPPAGRSEKIKPDEYIEGQVAPNALQVITNLEGDLSVAIKSLGKAGDEVSKLAGYFNELLAANNNQIKSIVEKTETALDAMQLALSGTNELLGNPEFRDNLKKTITELPKVLTEARDTMVAMRGTVESMDKNMRNLEGLTGPLGESGDRIVGNIDRAVVKLDAFLGDLSGLSRNINQGDGSLGRLIRDPELYNNFNRAVANLNQITRDVKPILANAQVFTDKIARHPESLGLRGLIDKSPGIK